MAPTALGRGAGEAWKCEVGHLFRYSQSGQYTLASRRRGKGKEGLGMATAWVLCYGVWILSCRSVVLTTEPVSKITWTAH